MAFSAAKKTTGRRDMRAVMRLSASPPPGTSAKSSVAMQSKASNTQTNHAGPAGHWPSASH